MAAPTTSFVTTFFDYDGTRASDMSTYQAGVPSAAERKGDFGEICAANGFAT
jgi:hypothetical protein